MLAGSALVGTTLADSSLRDKAGFMIIAVKRDEEMVFNPPADTTLAAGDVLVAFGKKNQLALLLLASEVSA